MLISQRQAKAVKNDVTDFCKRTGIRVSSICDRVGLSQSNLGKPMPKTMMDDIYEAMEDIKVSTGLAYSQEDFNKEILNKLNLIEKVLTSSKRNDVDDYISKAAKYLGCSEDEFLRAAVGSQMRYHMRLKSLFGDDYVFDCPLDLPEIPKG